MRANSWLSLGVGLIFGLVACDSKSTSDAAGSKLDRHNIEKSRKESDAYQTLATILQQLRSGEIDDRLRGKLARELTVYYSNASVDIQGLDAGREFLSADAYAETVADVCKNRLQAGKSIEDVQAIIGLIPYGGNRDSKMSQVYSVAASIDFNKTISTLKQIPNEDLKSATSGIERGMSKIDIPSLQLLETCGADSETITTLRNAGVSYLGQQANKAGVEYLQAMDPTGQKGLWDVFVRGYAHSSPVDAAPLLSANKDKITNLVDISREIVDGLVKINPNDALKWIENTIAENQSETVYARAINGWLNADSVAASEYVNAMPLSKARNLCVEEIVSHLNSAGDKASARIWLTQIKDPKMASEVRRNLGL